MNFPRITLACIFGAVSVLLTGVACSGLVNAQMNGAASFDRLIGYVGTWIATNPDESSPFLILKVREDDGKLSGTMSHFKIVGIKDGGILYGPLMDAETPVSNLTLGNSCLSFKWSGDSPFRGGDVKFVAEGTNFAYVNIPISTEETREIFAAHWGLASLFPTIQLHRTGTARTGSEGNSKEGSAVRLINQAEFQFRIDHGSYADYETLVRSGHLRITGMANWSGVTINPTAVDNPFPGHTIRLDVARGGRSYQLSVEQVPPVACSTTISSDESGEIRVRRQGNCP